MCSPHLRSGGLCSTSLGEEYLHNLFKILVHGRFVCSPPFNHLFISVQNHGYLLLTLGYGPILLYFVAKIVPTLTLGSSFSWLLCHFDMPLSLWPFYLFVFEHFLLSGTARPSRLLLCISCPSPSISHFSKELWFLLLENGVRNQDLGARCACC